MGEALGLREARGVGEGGGVGEGEALAQLGATQAQAGWVGAAANLGSIAVGCALAAAGDALKRRSAGRASKVLVVACAALSGVCFGAFAWCCGSSSGGAAELWLACAAYCLGMSLLGAQICLSFDLAAEHTFHLGPEGAMLMGIVVCVALVAPYYAPFPPFSTPHAAHYHAHARRPMNAVTMAALFVPARDFFSWINYGCGGVALLSAGLLYWCIPWESPRLQYDLGVEAAGQEGLEAKASVQ